MARGHYSRRRIRPGYLSCKACDRDLPEEEFRLMTRREKTGTTWTYRQTYCRGCESAMATATEKARRRTDPGYRDRSNRRALARYHQGPAKERKADRAWRLASVRRGIERLLAAGWSISGIAAAIDAKPGSIRRWRRGEGAPFARHADALRLLARAIAEPERRAA